MIYDTKIQKKELKKDLALMKDFLASSDKIERANDMENKVRDVQSDIKVLKD